MELFDPEGMVAFLGAVAVKGCLILALAGALAAVLRRSPSAHRHWVWLLGMLGLLLLPAAEALVPRWSVPLLVSDSHIPAVRAETAPPEPGLATIAEGLRSVERSSGDPETAVLLADPASHTPVPEENRRQGAFPLAALLLAAWGIGVVVLLGVLATGVAGIRRLEARSSAFHGDRVPAMARSAAAELGLRRRCRVLRGPRGATPMSWGVIRPAILLPAGAETWDEDHLRAVLLHELAHVRRWDPGTQLLARLALALHWPNPLAWIAEHRLRVEREHACDDVALLAGARPSAYTMALVHAARTSRSGFLAGAPVASLVRRGRLSRRIRAILDGGPPRPASMLRLSAVTVVAGVLLIALASLGPQPARAGAPAPAWSEFPSTPPRPTSSQVPSPPPHPTPSAPRGVAPSDAPAILDPRPPSPQGSQPEAVVPRTPGAAPVGVPRALPPDARTLAQTQAQAQAQVQGQVQTQAQTHARAHAPGLGLGLVSPGQSPAAAGPHEIRESCGSEVTPDVATSNYVHRPYELVRWSRPDCEVEFRIEGRVEPTRDFRGIARLESGFLWRGARVTLRERDAGTERWLEIRADRSGEPEFRFRENGREREMVADDHDWAGELILEGFRRGGFLAAERVRVILLEGGVPAALDEFEALAARGADWGGSQFAWSLLEQADLSVVEAIDLIDRAARRAMLQPVLPALLRRHPGVDALRGAAIAAARLPGSPGGLYRGQVVEVAVRQGPLPPDLLLDAIEAAGEVPPQSAVRILVEIAGTHHLEGVVREAFLEVLRSFPDAGSRARVAVALLGGPGNGEFER